MNDLPRLLSRLLPGDPVGVIFPDGAEGAVTADRLALIKKGRGPGAIVRLVDGTELPAALDYATLFRRLSASPNWFKPHIDHLVNLDRLERIGEASSDRYQLHLAGGAVAPLTNVYAPDLKSRLSLDSLDHVIPFNRPAYWMLKENLRDIEAPINKMEKPELLATFGASFVVSDIIGNFLWQFVNRIRKGVQPPLTGRNVRSLWYAIKPALSKLGVIHGMDHYKTVSKKLADYVACGMMRYREFGFAEEGNWTIGTRRPEIIIAAEKRSDIGYLRLLRKSFGTSVIALGGKPKTITSEYFTDAFKAKVTDYHKPGRVLVIGLIDYDPSGWIIGNTFLDDLRVFGIKRARLVNLITPANYTPEEIEINKYSLLDPEAGDDSEDPPDGGYATTLEKWMKEFGGINGEPYGLETDSMILDDAKVRRLIKKVLDSLKSKGRVTG